MKKTDTSTFKNPIPIDKWQKYLLDYTNYTEAYIFHYKKAVSGNTVSLSKYPYLKIKSDALGKRLHKAKKQSLLSKKQEKEMLKIQLNLLNACCQEF
jgi:hypothetical protein